MLLEWMREMAAYLKTLDPNHLITSGGEGFFGANSPRANANPQVRVRCCRGCDVFTCDVHSGAPIEVANTSLSCKAVFTFAVAAARRQQRNPPTRAIAAFHDCVEEAGTLMLCTCAADAALDLMSWMSAPGRRPTLFIVSQLCKVLRVHQTVADPRCDCADAALELGVPDGAGLHQPHADQGHRLWRHARVAGQLGHVRHHLPASTAVSSAGPQLMLVSVVAAANVTNRPYNPKISSSQARYGVRTQNYNL